MMIFYFLIIPVRAPKFNMTFRETHGE